jgi:hypothetical protein
MGLIVLAIKTGRNPILTYVISCLLLASCTPSGIRSEGNRPSASSNFKAARYAAGTVRRGMRVCGRRILKSPYHYDGAAGKYSSGKAGLPTYGRPGTDFPEDNAGVVLSAGRHSYPCYQLRLDTVYYLLLPGQHIGSLMAAAADAFVAGVADRVVTILSGNYSGRHSAIDSNSSDGDQVGVTIEYLTVPTRYGNSECGTAVPDGEQGGFKLWQTDGVTIRGHHIHNSWGPGGWADTNNANPFGRDSGRTYERRPLP